MQDQDSFLVQSRLMQLAGVEVQNIVDAGAFVGEIASRYLSIFPSAHIWAFEPAPEAVKTLTERFAVEPRVTIVPAAISAHTGYAHLSINDAPATNSLLKLDQKFSGYLDHPVSDLDTILVRTESLDEFCRAHGIDKISILKMDIQGAESPAFQGASGLLSTGSIDLIFTELNFVPVYKDQTPTWKLLKDLADHEYRLFGIFDVRRAASGQMKWGDALFLGPRLRRLAAV